MFFYYREVSSRIIQQTEEATTEPCCEGTPFGDDYGCLDGWFQAQCLHESHVPFHKWRLVVRKLFVGDSFAYWQCDWRQNWRETHSSHQRLVFAIDYQDTCFWSRCQHSVCRSNWEMASYRLCWSSSQFMFNHVRKSFLWTLIYVLLGVHF